MLGHLRFWGGLVLRRRLRGELRGFLSAAQHCRATQHAVLRELLALNGDSQFAREHRLTAATSVADFRSRFPITEFDTYAPAIEQMAQGEFQALVGSRQKVMMFALSSGTTASAKRIPITDRFLRDYRRGWQLWGVRAYDDHPPMARQSIIQFSSDYDLLRTPAGTPCGNISGLVSVLQNPLVKSLYTVPACVSRVRQSSAKAYLSLRLALADRNVGMVTTANPSTLIQLARTAHEQAGSLVRDIYDGTLAPADQIPVAVRRRLYFALQKNRQRGRELSRLLERTGTLAPSQVWPDLQLVAVWTGGSAGAYLPLMKSYFGDVPVRDHGLSASEGRMTIPFEDGTSSGLLDIESHYFEFVPEDQIESPQPDILEAHELIENRRYYILLTTASGLYRYNIRDVVACRGFVGDTPLLEFLHKGAHISSLTGEKLSESQVISAVREVYRRYEQPLDLFTVAPVWGDPPGYRLHAEHVPAQRATALATAIDCALQELNCEYADKRRSGRLSPLEFCVLPPGTWRSYLRARQSRLGASVEQYKHPALVPHLAFSEQLHTAHIVPLRDTVETRDNSVVAA